MTLQKTLCQRANANILKNEEKGKSSHPVTKSPPPNKIIILFGGFQGSNYVSARKRPQDFTKISRS